MISKSHQGPASLYLRLSITDRCNLRCHYCRPAVEAPLDTAETLAWPPGAEQRSTVDRRTSARRPLTDAELVELVGLVDGERPIHKLRLTGGEPLVRPGLTSLVRQLRRRLPGAALCLTTNGTLLARHAAELREAGIEAINVSLDSTDPPAFRDITRGGRVAAAIDGIRAARRAGIPRMKINTVLIRRFNGDGIEDLVLLAAQEGCEIRFIELMPCGEGSVLFDTDFIPASEALGSLIQRFEYLGPEPVTSTAVRHRLLVGGRETVIGFIRTVSHPFCDGCDRLRMDCRGNLISCLRIEDKVDLLEPLRSGDVERAKRAIRCCLAGKRAPQCQWPGRNMVAIGG